ncbi:MAG: DNA polymerase III subunit epsilon [Thiotrichales bacterium]
MRQIVLDTETTGLEVEQGHRVIEIGCVELMNRRVTRRDFHYYLQPDRDIEDGAIAIHGISNEFLADKPRMRDVAEQFVEFVRGAELIIHNAPFDVGFLNAELGRLGARWGRLTDYCTVVDTLQMARERYPGQKNNLDALCKRLGIDNAHRELHGALLDARILADVYLAMTGGQTALGLSDEAGDEGQTHAIVHRNVQRTAPIRVVRADAAELDRHARMLEVIEKAGAGKRIWQ